jgi:hypothetical protein
VLVADSGQTLGLKWAAVPGTSAFIPVATIDAKGDLLVGSANDAVDNLAVGVNGEVLTADSGQTLGVKWATPSAGAGVAGDSIWDAKGDLAAGTGADAAVRVPAGTNDQVLIADSTQTAGVRWGGVPAGSGGALTLLSTTTLGSSTTFDVSAISGAYSDLILVLIARESAAVTGGAASLRLNADSGSNYGYEYVYGLGSSPFATEVLSTTSAGFGAMPGSTSPASSFGVAELTLFGYASTAWHKSFLWTVFAAQNTTSTNLPVRSGGGIWRSTAAITRVQIAASGAFGNPFVIGSTLRIYGRLDGLAPRRTRAAHARNDG